MMRHSWRIIAAGSAVLALAAVLPADKSRAQSGYSAEKPWREIKCDRYRQAWSTSLIRFGRDGLSLEFVTRHEAFLASGCDAPRDVCPRSERELALANAMIIQAMNGGTASTFPPFACRMLR
jgi:hypothetical protein